jgi:trans-aconitate 2-methyltransferase
MSDWDPELYNRFGSYRAEPFTAILARLSPGAGAQGRIIDLGCGTGEHTVEIARRFGNSTTVGMDSSPAMIDRALKLREGLEPALRERLRFVAGDIRDFDGRREYSMIVSNAALQWLTEHRAIFTRCFQALVPGGRLVVQVPANDHETAQVTLDAMAHEEPWRARLCGVRPPSSTVAAPEAYGAMLGEIGFDAVDCYYQTFRHPMGSPAEIVQWCRATVLRRYLDLLDAEARPAFVEAFTIRLEQAYGTRGALTFNFRRLFIWARRPAE